QPITGKSARSARCAIPVGPRCARETFEKECMIAAQCTERAHAKERRRNDGSVGLPRHGTERMGRDGPFAATRVGPREGPRGGSAKDPPALRRYNRLRAVPHRKSSLTVPAPRAPFPFAIAVRKSFAQGYTLARLRQDAFAG